MKKPLTKATMVTMTAALAASAVVPVAASAQAQTLQEVVYQQDGQNVSLPISAYQQAVAAKALTSGGMAFVKAGDKYYTLASFQQALAASKGNQAEAIEKLEKANLNKDLTVVEGKVQDGKVVAKDETPEEKVNETFFYNLAA